MTVATHCEIIPFRARAGIKTFQMYRESDETGVSGSGVVLEGVLFACGKLVAHWLTPAPVGSFAIFDSLSDFLSIHVSSHPGNHTRLIYSTGEETQY